MESVIRFFHPPRKSYFLFGPRGTGKSTWIKTHYPQALLIDLLSPATYREYKAYPERLTDFVLAHEKEAIFVIDEIQKVPALLDVVHSLIESKRPWQFILTGSSARKLKQQGVNLLASRALHKVMHPFMAAELGALFHLENSLQNGLLPVVFFSEDPTADLASYVALYMKEEVQLEGVVRNVEHFARFLEVMSFSQGAILNYANIARECHVSGKTVENYVGILEDLLLSFKLPMFTQRAKRILSTHPKFYYFDVGVFNSLRPKGPLDRPEEISGVALETLVAQHLRAWIDYADKPAKLYFWRTKSGLEVDFVVYGELGFYAIEVKHSKAVRPEDLRGLIEFGQDYPEAKRILLYRGQEKRLQSGILCMPVNLFLKQLKPANPID